MATLLRDSRRLLSRAQPMTQSGHHRRSPPIVSMVRYSSQTKDAMLDIYQYTDFRRFVRDWLSDVPKRSARALASGANVSPAQISLMLNGKRRCSAALGEGLAASMELSEGESSYLAQLVVFSETTDPDRRAAAARRIDTLKRWGRRTDPTARYLKIHENWVTVTVLALASCEGFRPDPAWLARKIRPRVDRAQCRQALDDLQALNLLTVHADGSVTAHDEAPQIGFEWPDAETEAQQHPALRDQLDLSIRALDAVPWQERNFMLATGAASADMLPDLRARMSQCFRECLEIAANNRGPHNRVFQLNSQLFPVTTNRADD
jgi:uncharacterized protein (TIGR02147 family)